LLLPPKPLSTQHRAGLITNIAKRLQAKALHFVRWATWLVLSCGLLCSPWQGIAAQEPFQWWKGNLHAHTLWSDGDEFPEAVVAWYKSRGYHFLALTDHNILQQGARWLNIASPALEETFQRHLHRFGPSGVDQRIRQGQLQVRLRTWSELCALFQERGRFLLLPGEEITDACPEGTLRIPVHLNGINLRQLIRPAGGRTVLEVLQRNIDAVRAQRQRTGQLMLAHIAHPNFGWAVRAEDLMVIKGAPLFEVYNGHPVVHNKGDTLHPSTERLWDIALTFRLAKLRLGPVFGLAVDDAHHYSSFSPTNANPGRGWIAVRATRLAPASVLQALESGDFYASTGVRLRDIQRSTNQLTIVIEPEPDVSYLTQFIGTRRQFDASSLPALTSPTQSRPASRRYSADIGMVLAEVRGPVATYAFRGDELYVRAKVISSKPKANGLSEAETEVAWVQPVVLEP